jgi:hypothetical protein
MSENVMENLMAPFISAASKTMSVCKGIYEKLWRLRDELDSPRGET